VLRIGEWLEWAGISHREIAADLGVTPAAIGIAIKRGSRPRWCKDLAALLGVPPAALIHAPERSPYGPEALARAGLRRLNRWRQTKAPR
jgi:hypothetical protein